MFVFGRWFLPPFIKCFFSRGSPSVLDWWGTVRCPEWGEKRRPSERGRKNSGEHWKARQERAAKLGESLHHGSQPAECGKTAPTSREGVFYTSFSKYNGKDFQCFSHQQNHAFHWGGKVIRARNLLTRETEEHKKQLSSWSTWRIDDPNSSDWYWPIHVCSDPVKQYC